VLEGLDDVNWDHLEHMYAAGQEIPELVRGLLSSDRKRSVPSFEGAAAVLITPLRVYTNLQG